MQKLFLRVETNADSARFFELSEITENLLGSGVGEVQVPLRFPTVSKVHASVRVRDSHVYFTDLGSKNGSYLINGNKEERATPLKQYPWPKTGVIRIGDFRLRWEFRDQEQRKNAQEEKLKELYLKSISQLEGNSADLGLRLGKAALNAEEIERLKHECFGDGPLASVLANSQCKDLLINDWDQVFADTGEGLQKLDLRFLCAESYLAWAKRKAQECNRRLDLQSPICEATLAGGARFHAVLSPISHRAPSVSIRRFGSAPVDEETALRTGWIEEKALQLLREAVQEKLNLVISGGTSTGKTSLLNFLCRYFSDEERILTIEDTPELKPPAKNWVQLVSRPQNTEGQGEVTLRQLIQSALRMRPDRIVVGECRGAEVLDMLQALNTGHPGSLTTVHANSSQHALDRLELMTLLGSTAALSPQAAQKWITSSIQMIVQLGRSEKGLRFVREIAFLERERVRVVYSRQV
jgi:Flp pilus assembly CpaF family ATPase